MKNINIPHKDDWATPTYFYDELNGQQYETCVIKHRPFYETRT